MPRAVVLLSGGLDSYTAAAVARRDGFELYALSFRYGQRHVIELQAAARVARDLGVVRHLVLDLDLSAIGGSALTSPAIDVPQDRPLEAERIPSTYVPARNTIFLSVALGWAEVLGAEDLFIGVNAIDYSGYPDCRPEFIHAFESMARVATRVGVEGGSLRVHTPLISLSKADIVRLGTKLGLDYGLTVSCYAPAPDGTPCGRCDSCRLRAEGFATAGISDPGLPANSHETT
jgi:7-cyano-7-deazaguanine synthase